MDEYDVIKREALYEAVWQSVGKAAKTAMPGSITPETFSRMAVDIVLTELLRAGAITPAFYKPGGGRGSAVS